MRVKDLKKEISAALVTAQSDRQFMPHGRLESILTDAAIESCVRECDLEGPWEDDCIQAVQAGGRKILMILIRLGEVKALRAFVDQGRAEDAQLPFELDQLEKILHKEDVEARDFYDKQWSSIPALFGDDLTHRTYHQKIILPFLGKEESLGEGGFGEVSVVTLAGSQHRFHSLSQAPGDVKIVRKTLKIDTRDVSGSDSSSSDSGYRAKYNNEDRILTLLRSLRHDNIVRLLASYTVKTDIPGYNFLFLRADITLSKVLKSKSRVIWDNQFPSDYAIFQQLYGLASAIQSLHEYVDAKNLKLIGCHRDLKPQNILINKGKLLLADFGLSRVHPDNSKSEFKQGMGDYMAPECETDGLKFKKGMISRPSDIWSLGCVVMEILTYHKEGQDAVFQFMDLRRQNNTHVVGGVGYKAAKFYTQGQEYTPNHENAAIPKWLQRLERDDSTTRGRRVAKFRPVLEGMLQIPPKSRPLAAEVTFRLFFQAQQTIYTESNNIFEHLRNFSSSLELKIEQERFLAWGWGSLLLPADAPGFSHANPPKLSWMEKSPSLLAEISRELELIHSELQALMSIDFTQDEVWPVYKTLQGLIDKLWDLQRQEEHTAAERTPLTEQMRSMVERKMLNSDDLKLLKKTWKGLDRDKYTDILRLAAWKYMTAELESDNKKNKYTSLLFLEDSIETRLIRGAHRFGTVPKSRKQPVEKAVLVEYMDYMSVGKEQHWKLIQLRAKKLATLLSGKREDLPDGFRILRCIGYFHDPVRGAFGLMHDFPDGSDNSMKPLTLKEVIRGFARPELGTLFMLASVLAQCISAFHRAGWLHKNISAHNVLFFNSQLERLLPSEVADPPTRGRDPVPRSAPPAVAAAKPTAEPPARNPSVPPSAKKSVFRRMLSRPRKAKDQSHSPRAASPAPPVPPTSQTLRVAASSASLASSSHHDEKAAAPVVPEDALKSPYVVGFNHTRENQTAALTTEASRDQTQRLYQHPAYLERRQRSGQGFRVEYDWYSLGVVLLEIGLWQTAEEMAPRLTGKEAQACWLSQWVPRLAATMGSTYQKTVMMCLDSSRDDESKIEELAVRGLMRCYA